MGATAVTVYAALISWFAWTDVYGSHFFDHGGLIALYNLLRLVFAGFLAWLIYAPGAIILAMVAGFPAVRSLRPGERYALGFFTGAGFWHLLLFGVGFAGGYTKPVANALTVAVLVLAVPHLLACLEEALRRLPAVFCLSSGGGRRNAGLFAIFIAVAIAFVAVKGIYPGGGHDYYTHYFYYNIDVIKNGSIFPNEAWYHFYYSKGAGLYFLTMLLTDPLAPQLVTAVFVFATALTVAQILERVTSNAALPWIAAILYLAMLIFTPGQRELLGADGWGQLEKIHEMTATTFLGLFWMSTHFATVEGRHRRLWMCGSAFSVSNVILLTTVLAPFVEGFLCLLLLWGVVTRQGRLVTAALPAAAVGGFVTIAMLAINYAATGLPLDQGILYFWPIADLKKIQEWGVLSEVLAQHYYASRSLGTGVPLLSGESWHLLCAYLRLDIWWPIGAFGIASAIPALCFSGWRDGLAVSASRDAWRSTLAFLLSFAVIAIAFGAGRQQTVSFYRFSSFAYAPTLCGALLLCATIPVRLRLWSALSAGVVAALVVSGFLGKHGRYLAAGVAEKTENAVAFLDGTFSIKDAYQHPGWPGWFPWGGIYPAMEQVWRIVGRGTPIYTFHIHGYCMLPDCHEVAWTSTRTVPDFDTVLFGTPDEAVAAIKRAGINYFFYSTELAELSNGISTPIVLAPIFAPNAIAQYFGIKWSDGTSYLLTWRAESERPLDESFLATYRRQVAKAPISTSFPIADWRSVFEHFRAFGVHPYRLPWCVVCPGVPAD